MTRITIAGPGHETPVDVQLAVGDQLIVGRRPDTGHEARAVKFLTVDHPSVSASHLAIEATSEGTRLVDLGSTNGSLVELNRGGELRVAPGADVVVQLAPARMTRGSSDLPEDADYSSADTFGASLLASIRRWTAERGESVKLSLVPEAVPPSAPRAGGIPLRSGGALVLDLHETVQPSWMESFASIERYVARQNRAFAELEVFRGEGLVLASDSMRKAVLRVVDAAATGAKTLLILGPSGSGKEGLARCFHRRSGRAGSFVARNCGLFQRDLARSELFGAEKGAFSGCTQRIVGAVEAANQGTLFLDELGELPLDIQPMLLRFLDRGEYERMGRYGTTSVSDTLVVASTNKDLRAAAQRGEFRLDLWFRLAGDVVEVPPLRERYADIEAYLASRTNPRGESIEERLTPGARDLLASHRWDGNFRELMQFADRIEKRHPRERIDADACHDALSIGSLRPVERGRISTTPSGPESGSSLDDPFRRAEAAFREDHDALPTRWDDVKEFVENYLKPAVFASLAGAATATDLSAVDLRTASLRVGADRGTAAKQLARYFDRYGPSGR
ncbi:MAG: sigma 54-dependent Fis family transcriptional regulator [Sandaracinaceae bacterium]|nr:sigma 54-dependent Fis family transcriptional regulator [Sandaracinaceae bacterium]